MKVYDKVEALIDAASTLLGNMYDSGSQGPSKMDADENLDLPKDEDGDPVWPDVWDLQAALDDIRSEAEIRLPCFGIVVKIVGQGGTITSDLEKPQFDAIESLILAHACAGIDVTSPAYVEGIETAVEAIANHLPDDESCVPCDCLIANNGEPDPYCYSCGGAGMVRQ